MSISSISCTDSKPIVVSADKAPNDPKLIALEIAQELREHPDRWTQRALVRFADGSGSNEIEAVTGNRARSWCIDGHIIRRVGTAGGDVRAVFQEVLGLSCHLQVWNDESCRTVQEVIALCEKVATSSISAASGS